MWVKPRKAGVHYPIMSALLISWTLFSKPLPQFFHSGCNIMLINWRFTNLYSVLINHLNKAFDKLTQHYVHIVKMWASKIWNWRLTLVLCSPNSKWQPVASACLMLMLLTYKAHVLPAVQHRFYRSFTNSTPVLSVFYILLTLHRFYPCFTVGGQN